MKNMDRENIKENIHNFIINFGNMLKRIPRRVSKATNEHKGN